MIILLNTAAHGGTALRRWNTIAEDVKAAFGPFSLCMPESLAESDAIIRDALCRGERDFAAAGGDGTVNAVTDILVRAKRADAALAPRLGAVGLGSSNDFHKPGGSAQRIGGVPVALDFSRASARDVGVAILTTADGRRETRYWLLNASIGITADANAYFNSDAPAIDALKRRWTDAAIAYAALRTIARHRNAAMTIAGSATSRRADITNLGIVKNPHVSGGLRYDSAFAPDSGRFSVHLCDGMSRPGALVVLAALARGRFSTLRNTASWEDERLRITAAAPFFVECDGEVRLASAAEFSLLPTFLEVCP